jgi:transcriptional regulator with XRE-family HTH domain
MCEPFGMDNALPASPLTLWRKAKGWTLEAAAKEFGLTSKGYLSDIENGKRCSVSVALEIERATFGDIPAASLSPDVALVEQARAA